MAKGIHKLTVVLTLACDACGSTNIEANNALCARCKPKAKKTANDNDLVLAQVGTPRLEGIAIPAPTMADGFTADEVAQWHANQRVLNTDPRTAGDSPRPAWLVERVLGTPSWTQDEIAAHAADMRRRIGSAS